MKLNRTMALFALFSLCVTSTANATGVDAKVQSIDVARNGGSTQWFITVTTTRDRISCHSENTPARWVTDNQYIANILIAAQLAQRPIHITGTGDCSTPNVNFIEAIYSASML